MSYGKEFQREGERLRVQVSASGGGVYKVQVGDQAHEVAAQQLPDGRVRFEFAGQAYEAATGAFGKQGVHLRLNGHSEVVRYHVGGASGGSAGEATGTIEAPMTGTILQVLVEPGQPVEVGETVIILSAMKMEHKLKAGVAGKVALVDATAGDTVDQGAVLLQIEPDAD